MPKPELLDKSYLVQGEELTKA
ncbi:hypothetical protein HALA3H3_400009 [Halomonas sp. A3H3]|nr:conserved hypothetical protein [Halomonas sp. 156]CAD5264380.1 conserved hypothetical protein [Halomonas sp. 113]CAD5266907.1 conserved hypothetical protein [Halomonas sp. 59]CAD5279011.1 conserved hypothetical protein [Halomonas sp. I3]CDG52805.1 hypothetical protein HALA3H3_400009 [Halomonas sp. A3H3]VXB57616.1 conserved hypothetical protein [Halomonas titanicae]